MFRHVLAVFLRSMKRSLGITLINVVGLAIGFAVVLLIAMFIHHELSYDKFFENSDRIARILTWARLGADQEVEAPIVSAPMAVDLERGIPAIEKYCRLDTWGDERHIRAGDRSFSESNIMTADSTFFELFSFELLYGDPATALTLPQTVVLSEETSLRFFGDRNPVGEVLIVNNDPDNTVTVTGVVKTPPGPMHLIDFSIIYSWTSRNIADDSPWINNVNWACYVLLTEGVDPASLTDEMEAVKEERAGEMLRSIGAEFKLELQPLKDIYLNSGHFSFSQMKSGSWSTILQFGAIGLFILIIACLNFVNLTTARSLTRARQVGISKVLGASRQSLVRQFLVETVAISLIGLALASVLVLVALPYFANLLAVDLDLSSYLKFGPLFVPFCGAMLIGLLAGLYPALYLTGYSPTEVMRGQLRSGSRGTRLRSTLVVVQFAISIALIISTFVVMRQMSFIRKKDLGFDREQVVMLHLQSWNFMTRHQILLNEINRLPGVVGSATADNSPFGMNGNNVYHIPGTPLDNQIFVANQRVDYDYIDLLGMELLSGRNFSRDMATDTVNAIIVNEAYARMMGQEDPVGTQLEDYVELDPPEFEDLNVIGLVGDFHFSSLHEEVRPMMLRLYRGHPLFLFFRLRPESVETTMAQIEQVWKDFAPNVPVRFTFLDDTFEEQYRTEQRLGRIFNLFTYLAIFVASLGLFALAAFSAEQRTREIGVRKVLGASEASIVALMVKDFLKLILIANLLAWPVSWYLMNKWLEGYAYRTDIGWWLFPVAGLLALLVALITISTQAIRAANTNPIRVLRLE